MNSSSNESTSSVLQRSDHRSVQALEADIRNWVKTWNDNPKPFIWTKTAEQILSSLARLLQRTNGARRQSCIAEECRPARCDAT